jgi:hypothetical protein
MLKIKLIPSDREPTNTVSHNTGTASLGVKQYADGHLGFSLGQSHTKTYFFSEDDAYRALEGHNTNVKVRRFSARSDGQFCDIVVNGILCSISLELLEQYIANNPEILEKNQVKYEIICE